LYRRIVRRCLVGKSITPAMMVEIVKYELEEHTFDMSASEQCWVLDGMPQTLEQVNALVDAGLAPEYVVHMTNGTNLLINLHRNQ
jgi:adenylate kinase family enzyme